MLPDNRGKKQHRKRFQMTELSEDCELLLLVVSAEKQLNDKKGMRGIN